MTYGAYLSDGLSILTKRPLITVAPAEAARSRRCRNKLGFRVDALRISGEEGDTSLVRVRFVSFLGSIMDMESGRLLTYVVEKWGNWIYSRSDRRYLKVVIQLKEADGYGRVEDL
ncbi:hypothetical protein L1987_24634 [Smallanthus sonchifolius]|uniref:Uncharacterized protein n=1 Tax=Smallanthus sonchifolius TaxID=185202 RepID=A0ACB9IME9_9ASTR|nr:hypothetical protein L1987_24634 [Smallanthus sonchifolius]